MTQSTAPEADAAWLLRVASGIAANQEGEDLAQDAWVAAQEHAIDDGPGRRPWLRVVVRRAAAMAWRRRRRWETARDRIAGSPAAPPAETVLHRARVLDAVKSALDQLGETDRDIVVRRFFLEQETSEVARALGLEPGAVRTRLSRALKRLRSNLDDDFGGRDKWAGVLALTWPTRGAGAGAGIGWVAVLVAALSVVAALFVAVLWTMRDDAPRRGAAREEAASGTVARAASDPVPAASPRAPRSRTKSPPMRSAQPTAAPAAEPDDGGADPQSADPPAFVGRQKAFKELAAIMRDATVHCLRAAPRQAEGKIQLEAETIADVDVGMLVDEVVVVEEPAAAAPATACLVDAIESADLSDLDAPFEGPLEIGVSLEQRTIYVHGEVPIDDVQAYLEILRESGAPQVAIDHQREAMESSDDPRAFIGFLSEYDADDENEQEEAK